MIGDSMAIYNGLRFRTRLEARWAAFFDLAGWEWRTNPSPVNDWLPDFHVTFPCTHSECGGSHSLLVAVLPLSSIVEFGQHPCLSYMYGVNPIGGQNIGADAGAAFGESPRISQWEFSHGSGGGSYDVTFFADNPDALWAEADKLVL